MTMPDLTQLFRITRPAYLLPLLAAFAFAAPAAAEDAPLPYEITVTTPDTGLATGIDDEPARFLQNTDIDENILLPGARTDDDEGERKWSRDYVAVAAGVLNTPDYNGSDDRRFLPAFYLRGRISGRAKPASRNS